MGKQWITHWLTTLIKKNAGTEYGSELKRAFDRRDVMIASVTRLNITNRGSNDIDIDFKITAQKYRPRTGANMESWRAGW
jgi:hypothetical protein